MVSMERASNFATFRRPYGIASWTSSAATSDVLRNVTSYDACSTSSMLVILPGQLVAVTGDTGWFEGCRADHTSTTVTPANGEQERRDNARDRKSKPYHTLTRYAAKKPVTQ